jgi:hypothetical protein
METAPLLMAAILLALAGMIVAGCLLAAFLRKRAWARLLGLTMVLTGVAIASASLFAAGYFGEWTDLNPPHVRDQDVVGTWASTGPLAPHQVVTLHPDGRFVFQEGARISGRWSRADWNLWLSPVGREREEWRVILANGSYRLLRHYCGVEDACGERQVTFRQEGPPNNELQRTRPAQATAPRR